MAIRQWQHPVRGSSNSQSLPLLGIRPWIVVESRLAIPLTGFRGKTLFYSLLSTPHVLLSFRIHSSSVKSFHSCDLHLNLSPLLLRNTRIVKLMCISVDATPHQRLGLESIQSLNDPPHLANRTVLGPSLRTIPTRRS